MLNSTALALTVMAVFLPLLRLNSMAMLQRCLRIHLKLCKRLVQLFWVSRLWPNCCSEFLRLSSYSIFQQ